ncbi:hypothetical protein, partial [Phocaeicola sartorii]|uniref:hypothetical protein n=1 Tax=Phocaeicola sartorii TaxID=671267 RepID=UPI001C553BCB
WRRWNKKHFIWYHIRWRRICRKTICFEMSNRNIRFFGGALLYGCSGTKWEVRYKKRKREK